MLSGASRAPGMSLCGHPEVSQGARGLPQEGAEGGVQGGARRQLLPRAGARGDAQVLSCPGRGVRRHSQGGRK